MLPLTRENIIRYLPAAVLAAVFGLVLLVKGFPGRPATILPVPGHAYAYHSLAGAHENVWPL